MSNRSVAVVDRDHLSLESIKSLLESHGYRAVAVHLQQADHGAADPLLDAHDVKVIVYNVVPPYRESLRYLDDFRTYQAAKGRKLVVTTANLKALAPYDHPPGLVEVMPVPFDYSEFLGIIEKAFLSV